MPIFPETIFLTILVSISVLISIYTGSKIILKYFKFKRKEFILVGITGILLSEPAWPALINSILIIFVDEILPNATFILIAVIGLPIGLFTWLFGISEIMYKERQTEILILSAIYGVTFEIFFILIVCVDPLLTGTILGVSTFLIFSFFMLSLLLILLISGLIFARSNLRSNNPEIRLKGGFIAYALISYVIVNVISLYFTPSIFIFVFNYLLLGSCAISFYNGFISSKWMNKLFLRRVKNNG
jgi:hypothetical protein